MKPLALRWRVSLLVAGTILVGMAFIAASAYEAMKESLVKGMDGTLQSMATGALAVLGNSPAGAATEADLGAVAGTSARRQDVFYRIWLDGSDGDLSASRPTAKGQPNPLEAGSLPAGQLPSVGTSRFFYLGPTPEPYRAVWMRHRLGADVVNVGVALSSHEAHDALEEFQGRLFYAAAAIVLVTIAATTVLVGVGLRPIGGTARALSAVTERNVGNARLDTAGTPKELEPFVSAVSEMLERLALALDEQKRFVSDASHELRTPLSVARSTIDAAQVKDRTPEQYRQALDRVREDLDRMATTIEDLLVMARMDEGEPATRTETFDLAELVEDLAGRYESELSRNGGSLALELGPARTRGNRAQVRRLLANLLANAVQHGPSPGTVTVSIVQPEAGMVEVRVHDEGGGIPAHALPHLFDRFYRTDQSRARATGGVGLGLSIAREIALRHGGDITVSSSPERGTCFSLRLPAA